MSPIQGGGHLTVQASHCNCQHPCASPTLCTWATGRGGLVEEMVGCGWDQVALTTVLLLIVESCHIDLNRHELGVNGVTWS